jgi:molecular chaperone GrpE
MQNNAETDLNNLHQADNNSPETTGKNSVDQEWEKSKDKANEAPNSGSELEELKAKYAELEDQHKRLWADQQNMINRFNREKQDLHKYAAANTLEAILPALDNFDFAKKSINENTEFKEIMKSLEMLQEQLMMSLKSVGLEEVDTNIVFNPEFHEAVSSIPDPQKEEGTIVEVLKKGFKVKDRVLRVATVVVSTKG